MDMQRWERGQKKSSESQGHLDIVPVGGDWTYDPFKLTRDGDYVYGRGTTDDKGPL